MNRCRPGSRSLMEAQSNASKLGDSRGQDSHSSTCKGLKAYCGVNAQCCSGRCSMHRCRPGFAL
jgi:hypothetical protein